MWSAPIVNGRGDSFWKRPDFLLWRARDLDLGSGHTAYRRASLIDLYLHTKFNWNQRNILWMDGHTDVRTFATGFIRSPLSKSRRPNKKYQCQCLCLFVFHLRIPKTTRPNSTKCSVYVACGHGSILFWWRCDTLCTSGFLDDIIFLSNAGNGPGSKTTCFVQLAGWQH